MKKITTVVFVLLFSGFIVSLAFAAKEYPVKEISGNIEKVQVDTSNSYTTLEFEDGRVVTFKGIYEGRVFPKNKHCTFKYQYIDVMFSQGTYIVDMKCQE